MGGGLIISGRRKPCSRANPNQSNSNRVLILPSSDPAAVAVSIVVPVRNEAENVAPLIAEITAVLERALGTNAGAQEK